MRPASRLPVLIAVLWVLLVTAVAALGHRYSVSIDLTANDRHTLGRDSRAALDALDAPLDVLAVIGPDRDAREAVRALVSRYRAIDPRISLEFLNPELDPARARELEVPAGGALILSSGGRERRLQQVSERSFTGAVRQLGMAGERRLAFITGHGERRPNRAVNDDWQALAERLAVGGITSELHSLVTTPVLDEAIDAVVLAAPMRALFPGEIASLRQWVADGGHLLWAREPGDEAAAESLDWLSTELGVDGLPGRVVDTASVALELGAADFVVLDRFPDHPIVRGLDAPVLLAGARAFSVTPLAGQEEQALLRSPAASWTERDALEGEIAFEAGRSEVSGPLLLGVTLDRQIAGKRQRIALLGDADFAASQYLGNGANLAFAESLLLWLTGESESLAFATTPAPDARLALGRQAIIGWTIVLLAVLPLGALSVAAWLAFRNRRR